MQPAQKLPPALGLDQDISRLKNLFASSFPSQDMDHTALSAEVALESSSQVSVEEEDIDWAITLSNINKLTERAKASEARVQAAEARAVRAEAKAKEAEHWLRVLHKAVLEEAPQRLTSTE